MKHSRFARLTLAAMLAGVFAPALASAQAVQAAPVAAQSAIVPIGPIAAPVGIARAEIQPSAAASNLQEPVTDRDASWMIVGGAALLVGSMVEGDAGTLLMVGGATVGLIGLFRYLR